LKPNCPVTLSRLAFCLLQLGDIDEAENKLNDAKKKTQNINEFPLINFLDSKVARTKGEFTIAIDLIEKIKNPDID